MTTIAASTPVTVASLGAAAATAQPSTIDVAAVLRNARIRTGVVSRLRAELRGYHAELGVQAARIDRLRAQIPTPDDHDVRKQIEVLDETRLMIPDTRARLREAADILAQLSEKTLIPNAEQNPQIRVAAETASRELADANEALAFSIDPLPAVE